MKSIFVVVDSPIIMELSKFLFTKFGLESRKVREGVVALKIGKKKRFVFKLLEIQLQGLDGFEVRNETKKLHEIQRKPALDRFKSFLNTCTGGYQVL